MLIDRPKQEQLPALRTLWQEAFGDSERFLDAFAETAYSPDRCRCVTKEGQTVAALYWFDCELDACRIAYLYAIATARSHRGQGLCRALMEDTHRHLRAMGYDGAILVPSERSLFAFYQQLGYQTSAYVGEFSCRASADVVDLRQIDADEYAARRRVLLPHGGVLQENENMRFLQTMAKLYVGDGFLLAAHRNGHTLLASELLGSLDLAPAIVHTLGCTKGVFRFPGTDRPFAMFLPLTPAALVTPSYLAFAFD